MKKITKIITSNLKDILIATSLRKFLSRIIFLILNKKSLYDWPRWTGKICGINLPKQISKAEKIISRVASESFMNPSLYKNLYEYLKEKVKYTVIYCDNNCYPVIKKSHPTLNQIVTMTLIISLVLTAIYSMYWRNEE